MRVLTYESEGNSWAGVQTDDGLIDAGELLSRDPLTVRALLEGGLLGDLPEALADGFDPSRVSPGDPMPPIPDPDKIVCIGLNYRSHAAEAGIDPPRVPTIFAKFRNALVADGATVALPAASSKVDYEAEIAS